MDRTDQEAREAEGVEGSGVNRTLRSKKLRTALWFAADGKCQRCGKQLDPENWHADHVVPWSKTRRTNVHEMQALCPDCNLRKGSQDDA